MNRQYAVHVCRIPLVVPAESAIWENFKIRDHYLFDQTAIAQEQRRLMKNVEADVGIIRIATFVNLFQQITRCLLKEKAIPEIAEDQVRRRALHAAFTPVGQFTLSVHVKEAEKYHQSRRYAIDIHHGD